jgi:hypothetical protein
MYNFCLEHKFAYRQTIEVGNNMLEQYDKEKVKTKI